MWLEGGAGKQHYSKSLDVCEIVAGELQTRFGWMKLWHAETVILV